MNVHTPNATKAAAIALLLALAVATPMALAQSADAGGGPARIAVVNLDYVVAQSPAGRALQSELQAFQQQIRAEVEAKTESVRDLRRQLAEGASTLSEDKLADLQRRYEDAQVDIKRYQDDKQREGQKKQDDGLRKIEQQLEPVFEQIRDSGGYDLILNNVPGVVVMAGERIDITQAVIDELKTLE